MVQHTDQQVQLMLRRPILVLSPAVWIHRPYRRGLINPRVALLTRGCGHRWLMFGYVSSLLSSSHEANFTEIYLSIAGYLTTFLLHIMGLCLILIRELTIVSFLN